MCLSTPTSSNALDFPDREVAGKNFKEKERKDKTIVWGGDGRGDDKIVLILCVCVWFFFGGGASL